MVGGGAAQKFLFPPWPSRASFPYAKVADSIPGLDTYENQPMNASVSSTMNQCFFLFLSEVNQPIIIIIKEFLFSKMQWYPESPWVCGPQLTGAPGPGSVGPPALTALVTRSHRLQAQVSTATRVITAPMALLLGQGDSNKAHLGAFR